MLYVVGLLGQVFRSDGQPRRDWSCDSQLRKRGQHDSRIIVACVWPDLVSGRTGNPVLRSSPTGAIVAAIVIATTAATASATAAESISEPVNRT